MTKGKVAVTGASGYIAGSIIQLLLEKGYHVKGSVRSLSDPSKVSHLRSLFPSLELFEADLLREGSFDAAFADCDYVFHTASPFMLQVADPQRDLIEPALKGTENVMNAAKKSATVKRVVVTSSIAAIVSEAANPDKLFTEEDWNTDSNITTGAYRLSKKLAEEAAWKIVNDDPARHLELVTLNPGFVLGPPLSNRVDGTSIQVVKAMMDGSMREHGTRPICIATVDVRDVAKAHVAAIETPSAAGHRFILVSSPEGVTHLEIAELLKEVVPERSEKLPTKSQGAVTYRPKFDNTKSQKILGLQYAPLKQTLGDMARSLVDLGIVAPC